MPADLMEVRRTRSSIVTSRPTSWRQLGAAMTGVDLQATMEAIPETPERLAQLDGNLAPPWETRFPRSRRYGRGPSYDEGLL